MVKVIYSLILLLFSSSVFADFVEIKRISISDLLDEGFSIKQIDYIKNEKYNLKTTLYFSVIKYNYLM